MSYATIVAAVDVNAPELARAAIAGAADVAGKQGVVTQMGNQIQSEYEYRSAVELLKTGVIGKVKEIHAWTSATFPQRGRPAGAGWAGSGWCGSADWPSRSWCSAPC